MKILIADNLSQTAVEMLKESGFDVTVDAALDADTLPEAVIEYDILVVRSTKVKQETIEAGKNLSLIVRAGAGVNTIDIGTASQLGIHVSNCPGRNTAAVAELTLGLLIAADRRIADCTIDLRKGEWNKKLYSKSPGLKGRKLAVIGMGDIGRAVAKRARAFDMNVCGWSRSFSEEKAGELGVVYCCSPEEAFRDADAVTVHLAAAPETEHFAGEKLLSMMKDGSIFINTSRGEIVDTEALKKVIAEKGIRAALDVYEDEPGAATSEFTDTALASVITGTHHIGASTNEASEAIAEEVVRVISAYKKTGTPLNEVNLREKSETDINLVVRHFNRVGVLAGVLEEIRNSGINIEEMQNSIFEGGRAAVCTIKLDNKPDRELVQRISLSKDIINISVK